jgi:hypothetical protein
MCVFGWYWFGRFGVQELHTLDLAKAELEKARGKLVIIAVFLFWACLFLIGPVLTARRRHQ